MLGQLLAFIVVLTSLFQTVEGKWDPAGDTIALLVGLFILFIGICAGLGWYSRRGE